MEYRVRRIAVLKTSLMAGAGYAVMALVFVIPWLLLMTALSTSGEFESPAGGPSFPEAGIPLALGGFLLVLMPVLYGVMGFLMTALMVLFYNLLARWIGGVEFTLEQVGHPVQATATSLPPPGASEIS